MQNLYHLVIFSEKQPKLDTCCEQRHPVCEYVTPMTVEGRLLIKTSQTGKGWIVEKWEQIVEFPARQCKLHAVGSFTNN